MNKIILGKTGIIIEKQGFGCLPIQRISQQDAVYLLHKAYDGGINFFDTARAYSDLSLIHIWTGCGKKNVWSLGMMKLHTRYWMNVGILSVMQTERQEWLLYMTTMAGS